MSTHEVKYIFFENIIYGVDFFRFGGDIPNTYFNNKRF